MLKRRTVRNPPRRKEITTQVLEGLPRATHVFFCPEPTVGRRPQASSSARILGFGPGGHVVYALFGLYDLAPIANLSSVSSNLEVA
jgi:hypothetical protein